MEHNQQEGEDAMNDLIQQMFENMVACGISPDDAGAMLRYRYDHNTPFSFARVLLNGLPTVIIIVPVERGNKMLAMVTTDMKLETTDGELLSGPPDKSKMN